MYSKAEMQQMKREFWIAFAEKYPRKWLLYDTKIKDFSFKFDVSNRSASVLLDIESRDDLKRHAYFEKLESLHTILRDEHISDLVFHRDLTLESGKVISRVVVSKDNVGVSNRSSWDDIFDFFNEKMDAFEMFFYEFEDYIKSI